MIAVCRGPRLWFRSQGQGEGVSGATLAPFSLGRRIRRTDVVPYTVISRVFASRFARRPHYQEYTFSWHFAAAKVFEVVGRPADNAAFPLYRSSRSRVSVSLLVRHYMSFPIRCLASR